RSIERSLEKLHIVLVRDNRRAFRRHRRQAARMIRVWVCVEDVTNRLVGDELFRLGDVSHCAVLRILRASLTGFEHHDVALELDDDRIVTSATGSPSQSVEAVSQLFRCDASRCRLSRGRSAAGCWGPRTTTRTAL